MNLVSWLFLPTADKQAHCIYFFYFYSIFCLSWYYLVIVFNLTQKNRGTKLFLFWMISHQEKQHATSIFFYSWFGPKKESWLILSAFVLDFIFYWLTIQLKYNSFSKNTFENTTTSTFLYKSLVNQIMVELGSEKGKSNHSILH